MHLNTDHFSRCIKTLETSLTLLGNSDPESIDYEIFRNALPSKLEDNPLVWMLKVDGYLVDIRTMPRELQEEAYRRGLIPFVPFGD